MPLNDALTELSDSVRNMSGTASKLSISDMTGLITQFSAFKNQGHLLESANLDTVIEPGAYDVSEAGDKPTAHWGSLIVIQANDRRIQVYVADDSTIYIRTVNGSQFSTGGWKTFLENAVGGN